MNIPIGTLVEENVALKGLNLQQKLSNLMREEFTGYVVLTVEGRAGIEEGLVLFKNGLAIGAIYEYIKFGKTFHGDVALKQVINSSFVEFGVLDIGKLTKQQVDLIVAFNEKIELREHVQSKGISKLFPRKYDAGVAEKDLGNELRKKESKFDVFKKLGLSGVR